MVMTSHLRVQLESNLRIPYESCKDPSDPEGSTRGDPNSGLGRHPLVPLFPSFFSVKNPDEWRSTETSSDWFSRISAATFQPILKNPPASLRSRDDPGSRQDHARIPLGSHQDRPGSTSLRDRPRSSRGAGADINSGFDGWKRGGVGRWRGVEGYLLPLA